MQTARAAQPTGREPGRSAAGASACRVEHRRPGVHAEIVPHIRKGVVTRCETGVNGLIGELVSKGIAMATEEYGQQAEFLFTSLSKIKPDMVAEATKDARRAAEQFAQDSGSKVGSIRKAQQGLFSIEDRDRHSPDRKQVRVVTTVEYYLEK